MPHIRVVMIEPLNDGNIGAMARAMMNFGLNELVLGRPCDVGEEGVKRAMHAIDFLRNARICPTEEEALEGVDYAIGTSGVDTANDKKFSRISIAPEAIAEKLQEFDGTVAILFGREDFGLDNDLVKRCDFLVTIPASSEYPILNVSHAAAVLFYEMFVHGIVRSQPRVASGLEIEKLNECFSGLLDAIEYPEHKKVKTRVMFRRLVARSTPTTWEYHTLMGVLKDATKGCLKENDDAE